MLTEEEVKRIFEESLVTKGQVTVVDIQAMRMVFESQKLDISMLQQYIQNNFEYILRCSVGGARVVDELMKIGNMDDFVKSYLNDNFERFSLFVSKQFVFDNLSTFIEKNKELLNEYLKTNKNDYIKYLLIDGMFNENIKELGVLNELVVMIVDEVLEYEQKDYVDIEKLKSGSYSHVIQIGSKVIKLGAKRETYQIPNTSVLLQPLIRKDLSSLTSFNGTIEVMEKVETRTYFSDEELYQVYKRARDKGVVIADLKVNNIGILLKDNVLHWSKAISDDMSVRGISGNNEEILKAGEMVLLDSDHIYVLEDYMEEIKKRPVLRVNEFEQRYLLEQQKNSQEEVNMLDEGNTVKSR